MGKRFEGKTVLVTGATSGIGRVAAIAFGAEGANVVLTGRREAEGKESATLVEKAGGKALFIRADAASEADTKSVIARAVAEFGRLDVAFNNAGIEYVSPVDEITEAEIDKLLAINVKGVLLAMKHEIIQMKKQGSGAVVNTSSVGGHVGMAGASVYAATKHAVMGMTKSVALEVAKLGIRVNSVSPGPIATAMLDRFSGGNPGALAALVPAGRLGKEQEIAEAVLWLASDAAAFVVGQDILADGGYAAG